MTDMKRLSVCLTPELEQRIADLRKTDEFCRLSWAEIIRRMIERGLDSAKEETP